MKYILYSVLGLGIFGLVVFGGISFLMREQPLPSEDIQGQTQDAINFQNTSRISVSAEEQRLMQATNRIAITNRLGKTSLVENFLDDPDVKRDPYNPQSYLLGDSGPQAGYTIEYSQKEQSFTIALLKEPLSESRASAGVYLRTKLGLLDRQLCQLMYLVSTPYWVNKDYSGINLGFSFCPGATLLP